MILVVFGLAMAVACGAVWIADRRRLRRFDAPARCGGCAHLLAPGQMLCPECGRAWTENDPGAARVFGQVADRCERLRRASIVASLALGIAAAVCLATGGLFAAGLLPRGHAANAWWHAPVETRDAGAEWADEDSELWVQVRGVRLDQEGFTAGAPMDRVDEVRIVRVTRECRTAPAEGLGKVLQLDIGLRVLVSGEEVQVCERWSELEPWASLDGPYTLESLSQPVWGGGVLNWRLGPYAFNPTSPDLQDAWGRNLHARVVELCRGQDVRQAIRWGEQGSSFMPQDVAQRSQSRLQQLAIAALVGGAAIAVAATALVRAVLRSRASAARFRPAASSSS